MLHNVELSWQVHMVGTWIRICSEGTFVQIEGVAPTSACRVKPKLHFLSFRTIMTSRFGYVPSQCVLLLLCIQPVGTTECVPLRVRVPEVKRDWSESSSCRLVTPYHPSCSFYCFAQQWRKERVWRYCCLDLRLNPRKCSRSPLNYIIHNGKLFLHI